MFKSDLSRTILSITSALLMSATLIGAAVGPARAAVPHVAAHAVAY